VRFAGPPMNGPGTPGGGPPPGYGSPSTFPGAPPPLRFAPSGPTVPAPPPGTSLTLTLAPPFSSFRLETHEISFSSNFDDVGFRPPPGAQGMGFPPPGGAAVSSSSSPPPPPPAKSSANLINGLNPERAKMLGLI